MLTPAHLPRALRIAAYLVCLAVLSCLELAPTQALPSPNISDKVQHMIAYAVLTAAGLMLFARHLRLAIGFAFAFGVVLEFLQVVMGDGRQGDWRDAAANGLGVLVATLIYLLWRWWRGPMPVRP